MRTYRQRYYRKHTEHLLQLQARSVQRHKATYLIRGARVRATAAKLPFDLDAHVEAITRRVNAGICELTGIPLRRTERRSYDSPSLDRIVPHKGYVYTNIRVVCRAINCALGNWGEETLATVIQAWLARRTP